MKTAVLAIAVGGLIAPADAAGPTALARSFGDPVNEGRIWITGSSNVSRFTCQASGVSGTVDLKANPTRRSLFSGENVSNAPSLRIPVAQLDCGSASMNRDLREALRAGAHEAIEFHLDSYDIVPAAVGLTARIAGRLRIAGAERVIVATAAVQPDSLGRMHVRGTHAVRMTDFGLEPPHRFAGLVRVRDEIVVHFDIVPDRGRGAVDIVQRTPHVNVGGSHASEL